MSGVVAGEEWPHPTRDRTDDRCPGNTRLFFLFSAPLPVGRGPEWDPVSEHETHFLLVALHCQSSPADPEARYHGRSQAEASWKP